MDNAWPIDYNTLGSVNPCPDASVWSLSSSQLNLAQSPVLLSEDRGDAVTIERRVLVEALTPRELEVLRLMARGLPNRQIATALNVNERTIKYHVSAVLAKLDVTNRTEAVTLALHHGLISLSEEQT